MFESYASRVTKTMLPSRRTCDSQRFFGFDFFWAFSKS